MSTDGYELMGRGLQPGFGSWELSSALHKHRLPRFLPFNAFGMAAMIGVVMLFCQVMDIPDHARLASITVAVIMVLSTFHPGLNPVLNAALCFIENCIGTALAVVAVLLWPASE